MNFIIYLLSEGLSKIIPFATILVVAKFIDIESFGELSLYLIVYEMLVVVISNNISATTRIDYYRLNFADYVNSKSIHLTVSFIIFSFVSIVSAFLSTIPYYFLIIIALSSFLRSVSLYILADLQCKESVKNYAISNIIYLASMNGLFMLLIMLNKNIESWIYSILFGSFVQFLFSLYHVKKYKLLTFSLNYFLNKQSLYDEFKNGLIFIPQAIGFWIKLGIDRILLASYTSMLVVGYYMFAFQLLWLIIIISSAINLYATPKINSMLKNNNFSSIKLLLNNFLIFLVLFAIILFIMSFFIINNFYYEKYSPSLEYLPYISISLVFQSVMMIYLNVFYYIEKKKFVSKFIFSTSIIQAVCGLFSMEFIGIYGLLVFNIVFNFIVLMYILGKFHKELNAIKYATP